MLAAALLLLGMWTRGAAAGYEQGKHQAIATLQPRGVVLLTGPASCDVYPHGTVPDLAPNVNYRAYFVTLLLPDGR